MNVYGLPRNRSLDSYPPLREWGEEPLPWPIRERPCACGQMVVQLSCQSVLRAVQIHNVTPAHQWWRASQDDPTAGAGPVDLSGVHDGASGRPASVP